MILWKKKNWISNPEISDSLYFMALNLEKMEQNILADTGQEELELLVDRAMEDEIRASSGIEGIRMDSRKIRSSIAQNRGWIQPEWSPERQETGKEARAVRSAIHMMRGGPVTHELICACHALLPSPQDKIWGKYRDHSESVYDENGVSVYDAPNAPEMRCFMDIFIQWWEQERPKLPLPLGAALGHLFFEAIHPFHDGNGRIGRMLADKAWEKNGIFRPFSVSGAIIQDKNRYYDFINEATNEGKIDEWLIYMLKAQESALQAAQERAFRLRNISDWISKTSFQLDKNDLEIIYEIGLSNRRHWTEFEATRYMEDDEIAEKAWNKLVDFGIIKNGELILVSDVSRPEEMQNFGPK